MNSPETQTDARTSLPYSPGVIPRERLEFWADTCREVTRTHAGSRQTMELYRDYGCRFFEPGLGQVLNVLEALDSAMPQWERTHPELFYQTLEMNYPELVRRAC
jgi:hypothetical protein